MDLFSFWSGPGLVYTRTTCINNVREREIEIVLKKSVSLLSIVHGLGDRKESFETHGTEAK